MCEPTPISTVFSVTSSTSWSSYATSTSVVNTPPPITSTILQSTCVQQRTSEPVVAIVTSTASSSLIRSSSSAFTRTTQGNEWQGNRWAEQKDDDGDEDDDEDWRDWRSGRNERQSTPNTSIVAVALNAELASSSKSQRTRDRPGSSTETDSRRTSSANLRFDTNTKNAAWRGDTGNIGNNRATRDVSGRNEASWTLGSMGNAHGPSPLPIKKETEDDPMQNDRSNRTGRESGRTRSSSPSLNSWQSHRHDRHRMVHRQVDCLSWSTSTSFSTIYPSAETTWSTFQASEAVVEFQTVPLETIYASCTHSSAAESSGLSSSPVDHAVAVITSQSVIESPSPSPVSSVVAATTSPSLSRASSTFQAFRDTTPTASPASSAITSLSSNAVSPASRLSQSASPIQSARSSTRPLANANEGITHTSTSSSLHGSESSDPDLAKTNTTISKGITAGAVIGGIIGILLLIGAVLVTLRWFMKRKRQERTRELRSSWFYGGDVAEPENEKIRGTEERRFSQLQSRFSAPSLMSRESHHPRALPGFLALPIKHVREASGRFPNVFKDLRSTTHQNNTQSPAWMPSYQGQHSSAMNTPYSQAPMYVSSNGFPMANTFTDPSPVIAFPTPPPRPEYVPPMTSRSEGSDRMEMMASSPHDPPRLSLNGLGASGLGWTDSQGSPHILSDTIPKEYRNLDPSVQLQSLGIGQNPPLESYHSVYSTQSAPRSELHQPFGGPIGQAISAPGRESIEATSLHQTPGILIRQPSATRNLVPLPTTVPDSLLAPVAPYHGMSTPRTSAGQSSLFEYSEYDPRRASQSTHNSATTRATRNWYEASLWDDGTAQPDRASRSSYASGVWNMGGSEVSGARKSRSKSVRWGDDPLPKVSQEGRAL